MIYTIVIKTSSTNRGGNNLRQHVMTLQGDADTQADARYFANERFFTDYPFAGENIVVFDSIEVNPPQ